MVLAKRGWAGLAIDSSVDAIKYAEEKLKPLGVKTRVDDLFNVKESFNLIIPCFCS